MNVRSISALPEWVRSFLGDPIQLKQITGLDQQAFLADPQLSNSYNYSRSNPVALKDPQGNFALLLKQRDPLAKWDICRAETLRGGWIRPWRAMRERGSNCSVTMESQERTSPCCASRCSHEHR